MNFAYCICPSTAASPGSSIDDLALRIFGKEASIIIDNYNILLTDYSKSLSDNNAIGFSIFEKLLMRYDKNVIKSTFTPSPNFNPDITIAPDILVDITGKAITTRARSIICKDDSEFAHLEDNIFKSRISIITSKEEICSDFPDYRVHIDPLKLSSHLSTCIRTISDRDILKGASEDECNDQIRDMMTCSGYLIKDQTRRGLSSKGYSAGEVDLLVECGKEPYAIIEGLIVSSKQSAYIKRHITKALTKYDNIGLRDFYILVYYRGKNFSSFSDKYQELIGEFKNIVGNKTSPVTIHSTIKSEIRNSGYREFVCLGERRDVQIKCTHMLIDQG
jgi:hypothetical protein